MRDKNYTTAFTSHFYFNNIEVFMKKEYFNFTFFYTEKDAKIQSHTVVRVETEHDAILEFFKVIKEKDVIDYFIVEDNYI